MHKLDKEADEAHDEEPHAGGRGDLGELLAVGLCAYVDEHLRLLGELPERVNDVFGDRILARSHDDDAILFGRLCDWADRGDSITCFRRSTPRLPAVPHSRVQSSHPVLYCTK